ncbi:IclR family transcriptional regulator [Pigmentiphaga humi]|nr:IclR family transcriptional regulator [Pigmentiphaga humi]
MEYSLFPTIDSSWISGLDPGRRPHNKNHDMQAKRSAPKAGSGAKRTASREDDASGVRAISRAVHLLRILALGGEHGMRITDIVAQSGMSRPTVHRILQTLIAESVGEQDASTRRYRLGPEISLLGMSRPAQFPVRAAAEHYIEALANELGDTAFLSIRVGLDSVGIDRKTGSYPIKVLAIEVGARRPLGVGVAGVMLLASLPPDEAGHICDVNAARLPPDGPSMEAIRTRVRAARSNGYAYSEVGVLRGTRAVAVPVTDTNGNVIAALSVAAMAERLKEPKLPQVIDAMRQKAALITQRLAEMERARRPAS